MFKHLVVLPLIFILFIINANAQTQKHNFVIGGSGAFSKRHFESIDPVSNFHQKRALSTINLSPSFAYFIFDNLSIGTLINFRRDRTVGAEIGAMSDENVKLSEGNFISIGPVLRYYVPLGNWTVFSEAQYLKIHGIQNSFLSNALKYDHRGSRMELGVGAAYFINSSVGLEGLISFGSEKTKYESNPSPSYPNFLDFSNKRNLVRINLGLHYYLNKNSIKKSSEVLVL